MRAPGAGNGFKMKPKGPYNKGTPGQHKKKHPSIKNQIRSLERRLRLNVRLTCLWMG